MNSGAKGWMYIVGRNSRSPGVSHLSDQNQERFFGNLTFFSEYVALYCKNKTGFV